MSRVFGDLVVLRILWVQGSGCRDLEGFGVLLGSGSGLGQDVGIAGFDLVFELDP